MLIVLNSQNLLSRTIQQIFELIEEIMKVYNLSYAPFSMTHLATGVGIYKEIFQSKKGTFFDSLMIGLAINLQLPLLGNDRVFHESWLHDRLDGFRAVTFNEALTTWPEPKGRGNDE